MLFILIFRQRFSFFHKILSVKRISAEISGYTYIYIYTCAHVCVFFMFSWLICTHYIDFAFTFGEVLLVIVWQFLSPLGLSLWWVWNGCFSMYLGIWFSTVLFRLFNISSEDEKLRKLQSISYIELFQSNVLGYS